MLVCLFVLKKVETLSRSLPVVMDRRVFIVKPRNCSSITVRSVPFPPVSLSRCVRFSLYVLLTCLFYGMHCSFSSKSVHLVHCSLSTVWFLLSHSSSSSSLWRVQLILLLERLVWLRILNFALSSIVFLGLHSACARA